MQITYDAEVDVLYIKLRDGTAHTERLDTDVAIDFDNEGLVTGIEILAASERVFGESRSAKSNRRRKRNGLRLILAT